MNVSKVLLIGGVALVALLFFQFDLHQYLNLAELKAQQASAQEFVAHSPVVAVAVFFIGYVVATALSFPGAARFWFHPSGVG